MAEVKRSWRELQALLQASLPGTLVDAHVLAQALTVSLPDAGRPAAVEYPMSWRERLWVVPPNTRLGVVELAEALGRTRSWVYRHTGPSSPGARIPHRKFDGELVFLAGEACQWVLENESVVVPGRSAGAVLTRNRRPA